MQGIFTVILASIGTYFYVLILARIMGKKLISQMTFFDFIVAITLGSLTANAAMADAPKSIHAATAILTLTVIRLLLDYVQIKSFKINKLITSEPTALINKGQIVEENLKKSRITLSELKSLLREKDAFNLADVEFAFIEVDGKLSVQKKPEQSPLTPSGINQFVTNKGFTKDIIMDGIIIEEDLKTSNLDKNWLDSQLKSLGINDASEVFYAGVDNTNTLYVARKSNKKEEQGQFGIE